MTRPITSLRSPSLGSSCPQFGYDGALGVEILVLGSAALAVDALALIEEIIACRGEPLPYGVAHLARHAADLLPFGLKLHNLGSGLLDIVGLPFSASALAEGSLLLKVGIEFIARLLEIGGLGSEEIITRLAEPVVKEGCLTFSMRIRSLSNVSEGR